MSTIRPEKTSGQMGKALEQQLFLHHFERQKQFRFKKLQKSKAAGTLNNCLKAFNNNHFISKQHFQEILLSPSSSSPTPPPASPPPSNPRKSKSRQNGNFRLPPIFPSMDTWLCILFAHLKYFTTTTPPTTTTNYAKNYSPIKRHSVNNNKSLCQQLTLTLILLSGIWNMNGNGMVAAVHGFDIGKFSHPSPPPLPLSTHHLFIHFY